MEADRLRWNKRHAEDPYPERPSPLLVDFLSSANVGKALDIACGMGRNSRFLAQNGFEVHSIDGSDFAIDSLKDSQKIQAECVDLDGYAITPSAYDVIVNIHFLERRLIPGIIEGLKSGGMLFFETFVKSDDPKLTWGSNPHHFLLPNELLRLFGGLHIHHYQERIVPRCGEDLAMLASLVAQKGG